MSDSSSPSPAQHLLGGVARYWYLILIAVVAIGYYGRWLSEYAFYDQYYAPEQPIPYSHKLHAGELRIDCMYCHYNAERGKHAGVPPASVCLGCHSPDQGGIAYDRPVVQQLVDYMTSGEDGYEWEAVDGEPKVVKEGGVVHWERIHLLPDHVYFSHEWHVGAGVSCQTCHGPIEEMEVVYQFADLSMGWCIECHRNDNYVGGKDYVSGDSRSFTVGVGNYDLIRQRVRPDDVVKFIVEVDEVGKHHGDHGDHGTEGGHHDEHHDEHVVAEGPRRTRGPFPESHEDPSSERQPSLSFWTEGQEESLQKLLAKYPDLPRWRIQDLPESHRQFYMPEGMEADEEASWDELQHLQNAPTHCNTCHQ